MNDKEFSLLLEHLVIAGCSYFSNALRDIANNSGPHWLQMLEENSETPFLEPLLFAHFASEDVGAPLAQVLVGYLKPENRPSDVEIRTNRFGTAYLPKIGYLHFGEQGASRKFAVRAELLGVAGGDDLENLGAMRFETLSRLPGVGIEVQRYADPYINCLFGSDISVDAKCATRYNKQAELLCNALHIIERINPRYFQNLVRVTRRIVLFSAPKRNSFAAPSCHGTVFFNIEHGESMAFFLEELAHQCGHVVLHSAAFRPDIFLRIPDSTGMAEVTGNHGDLRTVYDAMHGLFTEAMISQCLAGAIEEGRLSSKQKAEILGRLGFILLRFGADLSSFNRPDIFTEFGESLYGNVARTFRDVYESHWDQVEHLNYSNQRYTFSLERFVDANSTEYSGWSTS